VLQKWISEETKLGNPALQVLVDQSDDPDLKRALDWSLAVNEAVAEMVHAVPPFPCVRESLQKLAAQADMLVCSATPNAALKAEWAEHGIDRFVAQICGQEVGSKTEILRNAKKYAADHALMIGDAPGDYKAAAANQCLFYPINPGHEEASWKRFLEEGIDRFLNGTFAGSYQQALLAEFDRCLPEKPSWPVL
jgi:phosphoglycolate phosphatase-like HAD superfamily hydrolase